MNTSTIQSEAITIKWDKKGKLHVVETQVEKFEDDHQVTTKTPTVYDFYEVDEAATKQTKNAILEQVKVLLGSRD